MNKGWWLALNFSTFIVIALVGAQFIRDEALSIVSRAGFWAHHAGHLVCYRTVFV